jgi:outer membrane protein assembly factor BamB
VAILPKTLAARISTLSPQVIGDWVVYRKPVPAAIDDWTHYLHNPTGNPVAQDDAVRPPRQLQWVSSPKWARHHEHMASMNAMVSSGGKVISICDHGPRESMMHPSEWKLSAHDAFNGLLLWEQPIAQWFDHLHRLKSGPASLPRRLVAVEGRVYVTLGIQAPVSILDADSGKILLTCKGTENTQEILLSNQTLLVVRGVGAGTAITAVDAMSGKTLWEKLGPVATFTLAADDEKVVYFDGEKVIARSLIDGSQLWASKILSEKRKAVWIAKDAPRLILDKQAVVVAPKTSMVALSAKDGSFLWSAAHPRSGYVSPKDLFVIDGLVWYGDTAGALNSGRMIGRDILTGEIRRSFDPDIDIVWLSHHRCHFSKATKNFILPARMGIEFVDLKNEAWKQHHWVRGGCIYGVMPCNGLVYTPPHACACYFEAKQTGYAAYTSRRGPKRSSSDGDRLEKGPAYGSVSVDDNAQRAGDWPVFRHDSARTGHTNTAVSANLTQRWSTEIGGKLTQPVSAGGKVYVASTDRHTMHAIDAKTGKPLWQFVADGRIDSPPSIFRGMAIFGSRDGSIYCLRCRDGKLVWRFRAMPDELLIMSYGQLESAWPVHGSVLIENGEIHCVAGRNMFLDGGLRYLRLDPATGRLISETVMDERDPLLEGSIQKYDSWLDMTTTLPDILSRDGENIYMRSLPFDLKGHRSRITHVAEETETPHLFSPNGFLEDQWFHRSYWTYARSFPGGWIGHLNAGRYNPSGRLMVLDEQAIYGYGRKPQYYRWTTSLEYRLFAVDKQTNKPRDIYAYDRFKEAQIENFPKMKIDRRLGLPSGPRPELKKSYDCRWQDTNPGLLARAMVSAGESLFIAGPKDIMDERDFYYLNATQGFMLNKSAIEKQSSLWDGNDGALLHVVRKSDGATIAEHQLEALPVFDGLIATEGGLLISLTNGRLICLGDDQVEKE